MKKSLDLVSTRVSVSSEVVTLCAPCDPPQGVFLVIAKILVGRPFGKREVLSADVSLAVLGAGLATRQNILEDR